MSEPFSPSAGGRAEAFGVCAVPRFGWIWWIYGAGGTGFRGGLVFVRIVIVRLVVVQLLLCGVCTASVSTPFWLMSCSLHAYISEFMSLQWT